MEAIDPEELARLRSLPWLSRLDAGDVAQLIAEYEEALCEAYRTGDRRRLDGILAAWRERSEPPRIA
jgi:hypothetical protein